jgi:hypothetical protein
VRINSRNRKITTPDNETRLRLVSRCTRTGGLKSRAQVGGADGLHAWALSAEVRNDMPSSDDLAVLLAVQPRPGPADKQ